MLKSQVRIANQAINRASSILKAMDFLECVEMENKPNLTESREKLQGFIDDLYKKLGEYRAERAERKHR